MAEFTLDTNGAVERGEAYGGRMSWSDLAPFAHGYIRRGFESGRHPQDPWAGYGLRKPVLADNAPTSSIIAWMPATFSDLHPSTLAAMLSDCEAELARVIAIYGERAEDAAEHAGAVYWTARQVGAYGPAAVTLYVEGGKVRQRVAP